MRWVAGVGLAALGSATAWRPPCCRAALGCMSQPMGRAFLLPSRLLPAAACTRDHLARCKRASNAGVAYFVPAHPLHLRLPCNLPCSGRMRPPGATATLLLGCVAEPVHGCLCRRKWAARSASITWFDHRRFPRRRAYPSAAFIHAGGRPGAQVSCGGHRRRYRGALAVACGLLLVQEDPEAVRGEERPVAQAVVAWELASMWLLLRNHSGKLAAAAYWSKKAQGCRNANALGACGRRMPVQSEQAPGVPGAQPAVRTEIPAGSLAAPATGPVQTAALFCCPPLVGTRQLPDGRVHAAAAHRPARRPDECGWALAVDSRA